MPIGQGDQIAAWAEWLRGTPAKAATQTLVSVLNRYTGGEPVIAVLSSFFSATT